jgi:hypothetical protein
MSPHSIGLFALLTLLLAGAALGHALGFSLDASLYLTTFFLALVGWYVGRQLLRKGDNL